MLDDVIERLLRDAVEARLFFLREAAAHIVDVGEEIDTEDFDSLSTSDSSARVSPSRSS